MEIHKLAPDEPLSPELVLVLSPELRAQALARLGPPAWPTPRRRPAEPRRRAVERAVEPPPPAVDGPYAPSLSALVVARIGQLTLIFIAVTILVLAMSLVANAMR